MKWQKLFDINSTFAAINRQRIYPSYGGNKSLSGVWRALSLRIGNTLRMISQNSFFSYLLFIPLKGNFMSWSRFNKLRFNIGLLPKLWSYFKQIWKERRSYNFYSFYGHWVTSFFTLSERYCQYSIFMFPSLGQSYTGTLSWLILQKFNKQRPLHFLKYAFGYW